MFGGHHILKLWIQTEQNIILGQYTRIEYDITSGHFWTANRKTQLWLHILFEIIINNFWDIATGHMVTIEVE